MIPFEVNISVPKPEFCKEGDLLKVNTGASLGLARVTKTEKFHRALELIELAQPREREGVMCGWVIEFLKCDEFGKRLGIVGRNWLPVKNLEEARAIFDLEREKMFERHRAMMKQYTPISAMRTAEIDAQLAQWEVLKEVWPETVKAIQKGFDASKDYNAEMWARTGKPVISVEIGDLEALPKLTKALGRRLEFDPINVELVAGWINAGYCNMKPEEYTAKINAKLGTDLSVAAMRGRAITKFKLTSRRPAGRPINEGRFSED